MMKRSPKLYPVLAEPDPFLRQTAKPVESPTSPEWQELIEDMILTMRNENGIGLAAIQIGVNARVIVIETKEGPLGFINPEITKRSEATEDGEEGCLSVPGTFGTVRRSQSVTMKSFTASGEEQHTQAQGLFARVIQHEIDHLDGILFIDKVEDFTREALPETGTRSL